MRKDARMRTQTQNRAAVTTAGLQAVHAIQHHCMLYERQNPKMNWILPESVAYLLTL